VLEEIFRDLQAYGYSGQIMQHPSPEGGGDFKQRWIKHYNNLSKDFSANGMNIYIMVDPASGKKYKGNKGKGYKEADQDYTAMMVVGLHADKNYYLLDMVRDRLNPRLLSILSSPSSSFSQQTISPLLLPVYY